MTRTRVRRTQPQVVDLDPTTCLCPTGPTTVATWRNSTLVDVARRHLLSNGCGKPTEHIDPADYQADIRRRR